ncbi:MAG: zinc ribbon domain-containing protein [Candidatus Heimdallarchaeota archaeon]|nr:MAG: zinc ribbon domain-containing protein [Candidatus Heimdallarchaeota archaeon]
MEPFVVCRYCGEKNNRVFSKCRKCDSTLPRQWESSSWNHVLKNSMKRCSSCNARIKHEASYCPKCGQKQVEETKPLPQSQQNIDVEFTKDRRSLEQAIESFDKLFADQAKQPGASQDLLLNQKKIWYFNQKKRFLERNISNEMFYDHLNSLQEYLNSIAIIPELLEPEAHISYESDEETVLDTLSPKKIEKEVNFKEEFISPIMNKVELSEETPQKAIELQNLSVVKNIPEIPDQEPSTLEIADTDFSQEIIPETDPKNELLDKEIKSLFSSIQYQVKELIFEQEINRQVVRIIPFSGSINEIKVTFNQNQILLEGCLRKSNLPFVNLELKTEGEPKQPSWEDPWRNINLSGGERVLNGIKMHSGIANQLVSLGKAEVKVESQTKGEICIQLTCIEMEEAVSIAYSLIKDLQLFFEISFY